MDSPESVLHATVLVFTGVKWHGSGVHGAGVESAEASSLAYREARGPLNAVVGVEAGEARRSASCMTFCLHCSEGVDACAMLASCCQRRKARPRVSERILHSLSSGFHDNWVLRRAASVRLCSAPLVRRSCGRLSEGFLRSTT